MKLYSSNGAMYIAVEENDVVEEVPVKIGDGILYPGEFVRKFGEKRRTSFEMKDGYYLRYVGQIRMRIEELNYQSTYLLFGVNTFPDTENMYFAFGYVTPQILFVGGARAGGSDVRIKKLEKFTLSEIDHKMKKPEQTFEQLELFEELI